MFDVYQTRHGVGRYFKGWSKRQWTSLLEHFTISTNIRWSQARHRWQFCLSANSQPVKCVRNTPSAEASKPWLPSSWATFNSLTPLITRLRESYSRKVSKAEKIKQRLHEVWQCSNTAFEWQDTIFKLLCFFRRSKEASVRWGGKVKSFYCLRSE